jgi:lysozyme
VSEETRPALLYPGFTDGLDLSSVQVITDAQAVADQGFIFATVKASEGVTFCDPRVLDHLHRLRDVGLICNVYTFLRPSQGRPRDQVERAYACAGDTFPLRLALDLEGAPDAMTTGELVMFVEEAVDQCLRSGVLLPEIYTYPDFYRRRMLPAAAGSAVLAQCPLWMAHYGSNTAPMVPHRGAEPYTPAPWTTWTKWQYSGNNGYRVKGITGDVDRNLFHGDLGAFRDYMGLPTTADPANPADDNAPIVHPIPSTFEPED